MKKIRIYVTDNIIALFPDALMISHLPRKKKKALKKKLGEYVAKFLVSEITNQNLLDKTKKNTINHG